MDSITDPGKVSTTLRIVKIQPDTDGATHQIFFRHEAPFPAVVAAITIVTHHKIVPFRHHPLTVPAPGILVNQDIVADRVQIFSKAERIISGRAALDCIAGVTTLLRC